MVTFSSHKFYKTLFKNTLVALEEYEDVKHETDNYVEWLKTQFEQNPIPISEYLENKHSVTDPDNRSYPSDDFLISLYETSLDLSNRENFLSLMDLIFEAWNDNSTRDFFYTDGVYYLYTGGWSGNEHIIDALRGNFNITYWLKISNEECNGAVWTIRERFKKND